MHVTGLLFLVILPSPWKYLTNKTGGLRGETLLCNVRVQVVAVVSKQSNLLGRKHADIIIVCSFFTKSAWRPSAWKSQWTQLAILRFPWKKLWWIVVCNPNTVKNRNQYFYYLFLKGGIWKSCPDQYYSWLEGICGRHFLRPTVVEILIMAKTTHWSLTRWCWVLLGQSFLLWYKTRTIDRSLLLGRLSKNKGLLLFIDIKRVLRK